MTVLTLKSQRIVARIIGLAASGPVERSAPFPGDKTDDELIRAYEGIGRGVHCLRIDRHAEVTYVFENKTLIVETGAIGRSHYYRIQYGPGTVTCERDREIPAHPKYRGQLRIITRRLRAPQPSAA